MNISQFIAITKALSDPHRARAFMALRQGELCVCQIIELFKLAPSTISKHMSILKQAGLVESRKDGRWVYYRLVDEAKNDRGIAEMIKLSIDLLVQEETIKGDDRIMANIVKQGLEALCRKQK